MSAPAVLDHDWTDDEDRPLGGWVEISLDELRGIVADAGGLRALSVFATLTDPDGDYGPAQIYTAWGHPDAPHPLVDMRDYYNNGHEAGCTKSILRKFVRVKTKEIA